ncbi:plasmid replication initiator TrfA [Alcaligenes aquatilis]|uniref:plasmid replication initiator TrfA n=1 Tax=Alcaligenes aquatilis TaxID=323284 RepID=UPI00361833A0
MGRRTLLTASQHVQPISSKPLDRLVRLQARAVEKERKKIESALLPGETLEQAKHRLQASSEVEKGQEVQLPLWPESARAIPNSFLRSALFSVGAKNEERQYINGEDFTALNGIKIRYKGERLDQDDLDVWQHVVQIVRQQKLGSKCRFRFSNLLKVAGLTDTGKNRIALQTRIERLVANAMTVKQGHYTYIGSLIRFAAHDESTKEWVIELDEKLLPLFASDQFTQVQWAVRKALGQRQLAKWLHGFYSSHKKPYPLKIDTLYKLCGSRTGNKAKFAQMLREALDAIRAASHANGDIFDYEILGQLVHIKHAVRRQKNKQIKLLVHTVLSGRNSRSFE